MKIDSPIKVALLAAVFISILTGVVVFASIEVSSIYDFFWIEFLVVLMAFIGTFAMLYFLLDRFISNKISVIYRTIRNHKLNRGEISHIKMTSDVLGNVNKEVISWANSNMEEIEKLKEQESFRREFIGNLAHELKTPIFSIQGYILTLLEGGLEDETINRKFLERASTSVDRITRILEDLDVITKIESEQLKLKMKKVNLIELAEEVFNTVDMKAKERNVKLRFNRRYEKPIWVNCDYDRIIQVFTNLINNSIVYGNEAGETEVRFHDMEGSVLIEVSDNGPGIPEEHLPRLFERFYRLDKSRARNEGGSGLGLAIVKHIIEAHGQSINVRSTVGKGSTFSFTLDKAK
ncbi:MAG: sensor histidine kinase [Flavobacteriales bacterium]